MQTQTGLTSDLGEHQGLQDSNFLTITEKQRRVFREELQVGVSSLFSALGLRFIIRWLFAVLQLLWSRVLFVAAASQEDKLMMRELCKSYRPRRGGHLMKPAASDTALLLFPPQRLRGDA